MNADPLLIDDFRPQSVARPASIAELGELVRRAAAENLGLYPFGGATMLHLGWPPVKPGVAVDLRGLDQVIDYPARDMTITVRAGITISKLREILARENQRLPIDVPFPEKATLGGAIAVNTSGPRRYGYGTLRDYVIGISFMNDAGQEAKAGGRVVKNVAGYDLCKLHIGALGTLGIVTQVTLKLKPLSEDSRLVVFPAAHELRSCLERVHESKTRPTCAEAYAVGRGDITLVVGFEDSGDAVGWQIDQIQRELRAAPVLVAEAAKIEWERMTTALDDPTARLSFKAVVRPSALHGFIEILSGFPRVAWEAQAGNGIVTGHHRGDLDLVDASRMLAELRRHATDDQGNVIVTRCPPGWKRDLKIWGEPRGDLALMRAVKRELDPHDLFNPGRFMVS